ncbi:MAG: HD domain-containing protein [Verrucomicrobiaceae bacterium]|nr:HD domain-containing protein [Verrucomicrobiaceae bacterium]
MSLLIAQRDGDGLIVSEFLDKPVPLASDIFRTGTVGRTTLEQAASVLKDFAKTIREYSIQPEHVTLYTTNILSEAPNPEVFLNRLQVASGCAVHLLDEGDMTRLIYLAALRQLNATPKLGEGMTLVSHIGPGNTRAMYFKEGRIAAYASHRLGIFRASEAVAALDVAERPLQLMHLEEQIKGVVDHLAQDFSGLPVEHHLAIGAEIQSVAPHIEAPKHGSCAIKEKQLAAFTEKLAVLNPDELVRQLHVHYSGSEGIVPALQTNLALARRFGDDVVHVPASDFQKDLMLDLLNDDALTSGFAEEIVSSAREVAKKFKVDQKHAEHVMSFAQQIFRELKHLHGLGPKHELLLRVAAILHEVGMFVSAREHHKHSMYLIQNTELFGISTEDRITVALLARYHRRYNPEHNHPHFSELSRDERMVVFKLAAILRLADALDRTHSQRIRSVTLRTKGNRLLITTTGVSDSAIEQAAINGKCDLFREIFGYEIFLTKA